MSRDYQDEYDEPRRTIYRKCPDGMCGADDCPRCHPERFTCGVWDGEDKDETELDTPAQP